MDNSSRNCLTSYFCKALLLRICFANVKKNAGKGSVLNPASVEFIDSIRISILVAFQLFEPCVQFWE